MSKTAQMIERKSNSRTTEVREKILEAAQQVLTQEGYHGFTTRRVAEVCGMSNGNLTYHFPRKSELLEALVARVVRGYQEEYRVRSEHFKQDPSSALESSIRWLIADTFESDTADLFVELWVHAKYSGSKEVTIGRLYEVGLSLIDEIIAQAYPYSDPSQRLRAARLMVTLIEGSTVLRQSGARVVSDLDELVQDVLCLVDTFVGTDKLS